MTKPTRVPGDDVSLAVTLKKNGATFNISSGASVTASVVTTDHQTVLIAETAQSDGTSGADWANSLVIVEFTEALTEVVTDAGSANLEVQVDDGGKLTWFGDIEIKIGTIT